MYFDLPDGNVLFVNSLSGAVDLVDKTVRDKILTENLKQEEYNYWKKRGYFFENKAAEIDALKKVVKICKLALFHEPLLAVIIPTYNCNLRCTYCYQRDVINKNYNMNFKTIDLLFVAIEKLLEEKKFKKVSLLLYGGEPLLLSNKSIILKLLDEAYKRGYSIDSVITNGTTLKYWTKILSKYKVKSIQVTIDGVKKIHDKRRMFKGNKGTFDIIVEGINASLEAGLRIATRANIDTENVKHIHKLSDFYYKEGWFDNNNFSASYGITMNPIRGKSDLCTRDDPNTIIKILNNIEEHWKKLYKWGFKFDRVEHIISVLTGRGSFKPKAWYCNAGKNMFVFDPMGKIYACWENVGHDQEIGYYIPKLKFNEIASQWAERTIDNIPECWKCKMNLLCGGGCGYEAYRKFNTLMSLACHEPEAVMRIIVPFIYKHLYLKK